MDSTPDQSNNAPQSLEAIHQCVIHSLVQHVIDYPVSVLVEYLATYPFHRGAEILYYLLLNRVGEEAHYAENGYHIVHLQPELAYVYVLAEQNVKSPSHRETPDVTIFPRIREIVDRMLHCHRFRIRHNVIIGEADIPTAIQIPSISLNIPQYLAHFRAAATEPKVATLLINNDCLGALNSLDYEQLMSVLDRMTYMKSTTPEFWESNLRSYYQYQLNRLKIQDFFSGFISRQLYAFNQILPEIVKIPPNLSSIALRLWFSQRADRAYLLGFDVKDGIPSDNIISQAIRRLSQFGIEKYVSEITAIQTDAEDRLTGYIGMNYYPLLVGKKLINHRDLTGVLISAYYSCDLIPMFFEDTVAMVTVQDIITKANPDAEITLEYFRELFTIVQFPGVARCPDDRDLEQIRHRLRLQVNTLQWIPARTRLAEIASYDLIDYNK